MIESLASEIMSSDFGLGLLNGPAAVPPLITPVSADDFVSITAAPYANADEQALAITQLYARTQASAADLLRLQAAQDLGLPMDQGSVDEYRNLSADEQVALTDRMARLIVNNPGMWTPQVLASAQARISNPYYGQPMADSSYTGNLIQQVADGSFAANALSGGTDYLKSLGMIAFALIAVVVLVESRPSQPQPA